MTSKPQFELDKVVFLICSNRAILMFGSHVQAIVKKDIEDSSIIRRSKTRLKKK